jgi:hypothetical protein
MIITEMNVLYFFDQPLLWTGKDQNNELWAFILVNDIDDVAQVMGTTTDSNIIHLVDTNAIEARFLFSGENYTQGTWDYTATQTDNSPFDEGVFNITSYLTSEDAQKILPKKGAYLHYDPNT